MSGNQRLDTFRAIHLNGLDERCRAAAARGIHVRARGNQRLDAVHVLRLKSTDERRIASIVLRGGFILRAD
jgi:hypothetical protein